MSSCSASGRRTAAPGSGSGTTSGPDARSRTCRGLDLHRAVLSSPLADVLLDEALDQTPFRVIPEVARIRARLVVHEFEVPHQADVWRLLLHLAGFHQLVRGEPAQVVVALEIESRDASILDGERVCLALRVEDEPI